jgi:hypothetical protein
MKEIKLRAWDRVNKEFVYVVVCKGIHVIQAIVKKGGILEPWELYTGRKDKNNVDVFVGDTLKTIDYGLVTVSFENGVIYPFNEDGFLGDFEIINK